jgi:hypothetical protein
MEERGTTLPRDGETSRAGTEEKKIEKIHHIIVVYNMCLIFLVSILFFWLGLGGRTGGN